MAATVTQHLDAELDHARTALDRKRTEAARLTIPLERFDRQLAWLEGVVVRGGERDVRGAELLDQLQAARRGLTAARVRIACEEWSGPHERHATVPGKKEAR